MTDRSARPLRQDYLDWVEEQVEDFKNAIARDDLIRIAEEAVREIGVNRSGQYQLTELLLCEAVDRRIIRMLKLPSYQGWAAERRLAQALTPVELPVVVPEPEASVA